MTAEQTKFLLNETDLPKQWYNIAGDAPSRPPLCSTRRPKSR